MGNFDLGSLWTPLVGILALFAFLIVSMVILTLLVVFLQRRQFNYWKGGNTIAIVPIEGILSFSDRPGSPFRKVIDRLELAQYLRVGAIVLRINSPGGTPSASEEIYFSFKKLREAGMKLVALMEDTAASGAFLVAMAAEHIVAHPSTITGSIGVLHQSIEVSDLFRRAGVGVNTIVSGEQKGAGSFLEKMTAKQKAVLQEMIGLLREQFCTWVAEGRKMEIEKVHALADGRPYTGIQAKELGLVDELGGFAEAVAAARRLANIPEDKERVLHIRVGDKLFGLRNLLGASSLLERILPAATSECPFWWVMQI